MTLSETVSEHLSQFKTSPFLFVGSGVSRRYLGLEDWTGLLQRFASITDKPYEYYRASANGDLPRIASEIAKRLHEIWWSEAQFNDSRAKFADVAVNHDSALKIEIAKYLRLVSDNLIEGDELSRELTLFKSAVVDGIITTNWDLLLENLFPDFNVFVGQDHLLFSNPHSIGEIYKIHGCCSNPNSLVVTEDDYQVFHDRNPYLAAKLLTVFVEHPVVFLGCSLSDPNITAILRSIASCLTNSNIHQLRNRLLFVQWEPDLDEYNVEAGNIVTDGFNIPVTLVRTRSFGPVLESLTVIDRRFPARILRHLKDHVYKLVRDHSADTSLSAC